MKENKKEKMSLKLIIKADRHIQKLQRKKKKTKNEKNKLVIDKQINRLLKYMPNEYTEVSTD